MEFDFSYVLGVFFPADSIPREVSAAVPLPLLVCLANDELKGFGGAMGNAGMEGDPKWARWAASIVLFRESVI